jgi:hypothetical protein
MLATQERKGARARADDVVSANALATHLGMSRQNVAQLTAAAVIQQRSDGRYDQTASRLRYINHLRAEHRRSPRTEADVAHAVAKTDLMRIRIEEKRRQLVRREDVDELIDAMAGTVLTHLSGLGARCSRDLAVRRNIDAVVTQIRREIAAACSAKADAWNEPPLEEQS